MKIFLSYGFGDRDRWIPQLIEPLITAFGAEVVSGEELGGERITAGVAERIASCEALIGFATRRGDAGADGVFQTHRWVTDEIAAALSHRGTDGTPDIKVLEIREKGVGPQGGIAGDRQYLEFDEDQLPRTMLDVARVIGRWSAGVTIRFLVLPDEVVQEIAPAVLRGRARCTYVINEDGRISPEQTASIIRNSGGLEVIARGLPRRATVSLQVEVGGDAYVSPFNHVDALSVMLERT